jgi:hypothetical protein
VSKPAHLRTLMPLLSRFISRGGSARAGASRVSPRLVAGLVAAAFVFAAQVSIRFERADSADALRAVWPAASVAALHSAPSHRFTLESHSASRRSVGFTAALPSCSRVVFVDTLDCDVAIPKLAEQRITRAAARGYDATAPPALS